MAWKIAILGCGSIGKRHLRNFLALGGTELVGVDLRTDRRGEVEQELGLPTMASLDEALQGGLDAVLIALPNSSHLPALRQALEADCHVFVEKPVAISFEGLEAVIAMQERKGLVGFMGSNFKFHPSFRQMKTWLEAGRIGRVLSARVVAGQYLPDWHPWEDYRQGYSARKALGGGVLFDSHELDYLTWLLGPVSQVACMAGRVGDLEIDTEDLAIMLFKFASGALGQVQVDYLQRSYLRRYEFCGTEGSLLWEFGTGRVSLYTAATQQWTHEPEPHDYQINNMYLEQAIHFLSCLEGQEQPLTTLRKGMEILHLLETARTSSQEHRFVEVPR